MREGKLIDGDRRKREEEMGCSDIKRQRAKDRDKVRQARKDTQSNSEFIQDDSRWHVL